MHLYFFHLFEGAAQFRDWFPQTASNRKYICMYYLEVCHLLPTSYTNGSLHGLLYLV